MTTWYCVAPFRQAYIDPTGVSACCQIKRSNVSLNEWQHSSQLKDLQQDFLQGRVPKECSECVKQEELFGDSLRTQSNRDYNNQIFTDTKIDFVDYRSCNICNYKCRSCNPTFSHGIAKEAMENHSTLGRHFFIANKFVEVSDNNHQWIIDNINQIKRLMFTGGEPTVIPYVKQIIDQILTLNLTDISILITTNGSFTNSYWKDLVHKIPNLHWTLSLDAVGPAAEIIRHGTKWSIVEDNARWLAQNASSLIINTVVTNISVMHLGPLLKFVRELQQNSNGRNGCDHRFFVSQRPYRLSADNLDPALKLQALQYLQNCNQLDLDSSQQNMLQGLIKQIEISEFDPALWEKSCNYNSTLDMLRNENHESLFKASI